MAETAPSLSHSPDIWQAYVSGAGADLDRQPFGGNIPHKGNRPEASKRTLAGAPRKASEPGAVPLLDTLRLNGLCPPNAPLLRSVTNLAFAQVQERQRADLAEALRRKRKARKAQRLEMCGLLAHQARCSNCSDRPAGVLFVGLCDLVRLCPDCARRAADEMRARLGRLLQAQQNGRVRMVTFGTRPAPGEKPTDSSCRKRARAQARGLVKVLKAYGNDRGFTAYEHGGETLNLHGHMLAVSLKADRSTYVPRFELQIASLRATRIDAPGKQLPERILRAVQVAAVAIDADTLEPVKLEISAARVEVEEWAAPRSASWDVDIREVTRKGGRYQIAEVVKYLTKPGELTADQLVEVDQAWQKARRCDVWGAWRGMKLDGEEPAGAACPKCGAINSLVPDGPLLVRRGREWFPYVGPAPADVGRRRGPRMRWHVVRKEKPR